MAEADGVASIGSVRRQGGGAAVARVLGVAMPSHGEDAAVGVDCADALVAVIGDIDERRRQEDSVNGTIGSDAKNMMVGIIRHVDISRVIYCDSGRGT
ncbi:MAG: hypothetical protein HUU41_05000 [Bryobacteraceae bacterium]|nr:hypothetical protein [Bryobacterales bacterium]NUN00450.1 hypothetical protein [Bryobacteraceae bacterium]